MSEYVLPLNSGPDGQVQGGEVVKMKPKRPTDEQVMLIAKAGLMARDWLVLWTSESQMCLVHRSNGKTRRIEI